MPARLLAEATMRVSQRACVYYDELKRFVLLPRPEEGNYRVDAINEYGEAQGFVEVPTF